MIGGQALIEGLMMKGPVKTCVAVRRPAGGIYTEISGTKKNPLRKIPFIRGVAAMVQNLAEGYAMITKSADLAFPDQAEEEESKLDRWIRQKLGDKMGAAVGAAGMVLGVVLALALFMAVPTLLVKLLEGISALEPYLRLPAVKALAEGIIKILIFLGYLFAVTRMKDIRRVFQYHGAEHKTITCYERGDELTVENVRKHRRFHPRCGTSFIFIVLIVSIVVFSFISWDNALVRLALKLASLPLVMGIAYEVIMFAGRHDNLFCRALSAPGMWVQRLTTFEPDDGQIEVGIAAFKAVLPDDGSDEI
jgi:uncharacterized protein YqhQ